MNGKKLAPLALLDELNEIAAAQWRRPHGHRRKPPRRHEVARRVRNARRHAARHRASRARIALRSTARRRTTSRCSRCVTPRWSTTACGSRRCARRSTRSSPARSSASPAPSALSLFKGNVNVTSRNSPYSLYRTGSRQLQHDAATTRRTPKASSISSRCRSPCRELEGRGEHDDASAGQKMWGGRFERGPDASFYEFERSWQFDRRLLPQELALDRAWARAIAAAGILTATRGSILSRPSMKSRARAIRYSVARRLERRRRSPFR